MYFNQEEKKTTLHISLTHKYAIISNCYEYTFRDKHIYMYIFHLNVNIIDNIYIMQKNLFNVSHTSRLLLTFFVWLSLWFKIFRIDMYVQRYLYIYIISGIY